MSKESNLKRIDGIIAKVRKNYEDTCVMVQEAAVAILEHAKEHGDCSRAKLLCRAVPPRERDVLIHWFITYSPIGVRMGRTSAQDQSNFVQNTHKVIAARLAANPPKEIWDIEAAKMDRWDQDRDGAPPLPKPLNTLDDFWSKIDGLLKRVEADALKTGENAVYKAEDQQKVYHAVNGMNKLLASLKAITVVNEPPKSLEEVAKEIQAEPKEKTGTPETNIPVGAAA